jgi:hypothetical protein
VLQRSAGQEDLRPPPDAGQEGVVGAESQTSDLTVHIDRLDERKSEVIEVSLKDVDLELSVRVRRNSNAVIERASIRDGRIREPRQSLEGELSAVSQ